MKYRDTLGRLFTPGVIADIPTGNLLWVDAVHGNDDLAVRERLTVPFKTLGAAKGAAQSGDTIMVLPGTYDENNLLSNGVNWHFLSGAVVSYTGADSKAIFDTSGGAVSAVVTGRGEFINNKATGTRNVIYSAVNGSVLHIESQRMQSLHGDCVRIDAASGTLRLKVWKDIQAAIAGIWVSGSATDNVVRVHTIYCSTGPCLYVSGGSATLYAHMMSSWVTTLGAVHISGGSGTTSVHAFEIFSGQSPGLFGGFLRQSPYQRMQDQEHGKRRKWAGCQHWKQRLPLGEAGQLRADRLRGLLHCR